MEKGWIVGNTSREALTSFFEHLATHQGKDFNIDEILADIGYFYKADRAYIFEKDATNQYINNTYEWCEEGIVPEIDLLQNIPVSTLKSWEEEFNRNGAFFLRNNREYASEHPFIADLLSQQDIDCLLAAPITVEGEILGFLGVDNPKAFVDDVLLLTVLSITIYKEILYARQVQTIDKLNKAKAEVQLTNTVVEKSGMGIWKIYGFEDNCLKTVASDQMKYLLGIEEEDMSPEQIYNFWFGRIHPQDAQSVINLVNEMQKEGHSEITYRYDHPTKGQIYVRCGGTCLQQEDGTIILTGYHSDVTKFVLREEKAKEEIAKKVDELEENNEIIASAGFGIFRFEYDENGKPCGLTGNEKWRELLGMPAHITDSKEQFEFYLSHVAEESRSLIADDYEEMYGGKLMVRNFAYMHPTLGKRYLAVGGTSHINKHGKHTSSGYIGDITGKMDEELRNSASLKEALQKAEAASLAKTTFLNNMSHDIRTPMNAILGFTQIMKSKTQNPEAIENYLFKIQNAGEFLLTIINNVLDMARIESGHTQLDEEIIDISNEDTTAIVLFTDEVKNKNIDFNATLLVEHPYIWADKAKINQVTVNLLSNAIKYTPEGGSVKVKMEEQECDIPGYGKYVMTISDTGIGMTPEFVNHIFDSFSRERSTTESGIIGSGLGMAIVKKLVDMMGGTIEVESELGKGTTFVVTLVHRIASSSNEYIDSQNGVEVHGSTLIGKRILLAEDNDLNAEIAMTIMEEEGLIVDRAENGVVCIDMLVKAKPDTYDVILMDIQMPYLDGYETTKRIRALEDTKKANIPIIAVTANAFEEDRKRAIKEGMNGHVAKPIDMNELFKILQEVI